jgi:hypothetical protein
MSVSRWTVASLDEIQRQASSGGSVWHRVRIHLGIRAFGVNAFSGDAGTPVIEEHTETGSTAGGHEELYVVVRGRAVFDLDGEEVDAPPATFVYVPDPGVRRGAVAAEDGTTVLALGGKAGQPFTVSPWEDATGAWEAYEAKDYERAAEILAEALERHPGAAGLLYNLACVEALAGDRDAALEHLGRAVVEDRFRSFARSDEDLASIRDDPRFPG